MADYQQPDLKIEEYAPAAVKVEEVDSPAVETSDRGLFGFGKKEEKKNEDEAIASEFDHKVQICPAKKEEPEHEEKEEKKHESLLQKLHRSDSSSSSSSDEEDAEEGGEKKKKKKKKKGLKEKISGEDDDKNEEENVEVPCEGTEIPIEKTDESEQKKGFLDKIKEKLPGGKKTEEVTHTPPPPVTEYSETAAETEGKEKKGFLEKIKEKIPGLHPKHEEDHKEKEKEKDDACN